MKKLIALLIVIPFYVVVSGQIVADHNAVDDFDMIPDYYIQEVKKMLVEMAGESHSSTFNYGQSLLEKLDPKYATHYWATTPPAETSDNLRLGKINNLGEETYFTNSTAITDYKTRIATQNNTGNEFDVMGFVWCWDMYYSPSPRGGVDPVYNVRWGAMLEGSPDTSLPWGLDADDYSLTGNTISMQNYLDAVVEYQQYCIDNGWGTKIVFTTGPVDDSYPDSEGTEDGVQREFKHDYIREFVNQEPSRILFDYADILCWNNSGEKYEGVWDDNGTPRKHAHIHPDNNYDYDDNFNPIPGVEDGDHIGEVGSLRITKALWWMLARIAGWESDVPTGDIPQANDKPGVSVKVYDNHILIDLVDSSDYKSIAIYNMLGVMIVNRTIKSNTVSIEKNSMNRGVYLAVLTGLHGGNEVVKFLIN